MLFIALLLAAAIWAAAATPAAAAEVHVEGGCAKYDICSFEAVFSAAPGERNALVVTRPQGETAVVFTDGGASLVTGPGCALVDPHTARCAASGTVSLATIADLGDRDDRATSDGGSVDGGAGNDDLTTSGGALTGGPGADVLRADQRGAYFSDGDGRTPARDRYLGGPGLNTLSYEGRTDHVRVDLRRAGPGGAPGEHDYVEGIENATGGSGDDVLIGNGRANALIGGAGADRLLGLGGDDRIETGDPYRTPRVQPARGDEVDGGPGEDNIHVTSDAGGGGNVIRCGSGRDFVDETARFDRIAGDCERLALGGSLQIFVHPRAVLATARSAILTVGRCECALGRYAVLAGRRPIGSAHGTVGRLVLRLDAKGRRLLAQRGRLLVTIQYRERFGGKVDIDGFRIEIRLRR